MSSYPELISHADYDSENREFLDSTTSDSVSNGNLGTDNIIYRQYSFIDKSCSPVKVKSSPVCCGDDTTRPWLLRSAFLLVIAFGLSVSYLEVRFSTYRSKRMSLKSGDQLLIPVSTYLNKEVKFNISEEDAHNLQLYVLKKVPDISSNIVTYRAGGVFDITSWTYQYWGFYLLEGSSLKISVCADLQVQFYLIKGVKKLEKWTQQILYDGYYYHKTIFPKHNCNKRSDFKEHQLSVSHSDMYYILFSSSAAWRFLTQISIVLHFNRTTYDLKDVKYSCVLSNVSCMTSLDYATNDISLVEGVIHEANMNPFHSINLTYSPMPRHSFYLKLFGGIYLFIFAISIIYIIWRICVNGSCSNSEGRDFFPSRLYIPRYTGSSLNGNPWVVVSNDSTLSTKTVHNIHDQSHENINSREYMKNQSESANVYPYRSDYDNSQQFLDSCLTSAGTSAI